MNKDIFDTSHGKGKCKCLPRISLILSSRFSCLAIRISQFCRPSKLVFKFFPTLTPPVLYTFLIYLQYQQVRQASLPSSYILYKDTHVSFGAFTSIILQFPDYFFISHIIENIWYSNIFRSRKKVHLYYKTFSKNSDHQRLP